jgi:hypothetical protein
MLSETHHDHFALVCQQSVCPMRRGMPWWSDKMTVTPLRVYVWPSAAVKRSDSVSFMWGCVFLPIYLHLHSHREATGCCAACALTSDLRSLGDRSIIYKTTAQFRTQPAKSSHCDWCHDHRWQLCPQSACVDPPIAMRPCGAMRLLRIQPEIYAFEMEEVF